MKKVTFASLCALVVVVVVLLAEAGVTQAVTCSVSELRPCLPAFTSSQPPSKACCDKLVEQKPCLCGYKKDPSLSQFVNSANAQRVSSTCGVPMPNC